MRPLLRLGRLALREWRWVLLGILLSLTTLLSNVALLALSSWFIASMAVAGATGAAIDYATPAAAIRALALSRAGGRYAERLVNHSTTFRILASLRSWFFRKVEPLAPAGLQRYRGGDLLSRIRADVDTLDDFYVRLLVPSVVAVLALACIVPFVVRYDSRVVAIDSLGLLSGGVLVPLVLKLLARRAGRERVVLEAELRAMVVEQVRGMAELVAFGAAEPSVARLLETSSRLDRRRRRLASLEGLGEGGIIAASATAVWLTAAVLVPRVGEGRISPADFAMLTVFVLATFESIMPLPLVIQRIGEMSAAAERLFEIADAPNGSSREPSGGRTAAPQEMRRGTTTMLAVEELSFRYAAELPPALERISFKIESGERVALVGPTGSGKSTIVSLLLRFWDYTQGSIRVGGRELRELGEEEARALFAVCPQELYLFHASIRENLALASPEVEDEAMWAALKAVQLASFVESLPEKLAAIVGETGRRLSTGQARRLALARTLLKPAPILVLDEPTEGIDDGTADRLLEAIMERASSGGTGARGADAAGPAILIITHRKRDLRFVQRVVELERVDSTSAGS